MFKSFAVITCVSLASAAFASPDKTETLNGVNLESEKQSSVRTYSGKIERTLPFAIDLVKKGVTNFTEKCNNSFKDKRKYTSQTVDCKYHNENLVETFQVTDIKENQTLKGFSEYYLLGRQVYNRGAFGYYELVTVSESTNEKNQKTIRVIQRMLNDDEAKMFTSPKFSRESAFDSSMGTFVLTSLGPNETQVQYEYSAETDHWLLNKEVSVPQVFASISKSINQLVSTIEEESIRQKRELASKE